MSIKTAMYVFLPMFVLFFCYQNCQKPPYADELNPANPDVQDSNVEQKAVIDLDPTQIQNLVFNERMPVQMNHSGKVFTLLDLVQFSIDWQTGEVRQMTSQNQFMAKYCVSKESLDELKNLMASSKVCEFQKPVVAGQVCSQVLVPGYAKVLTQNGELELSSQDDGCGTGRIDFCDDGGMAVKEWFNALKVNLPNLSCN